MSKAAKDGQKPIVFEYLFNQRYNSSSLSFSDPLINGSDIVDAINHCNAHHGTTLSTRNPANFLKDYLRSHSRNIFWPDAIRSAGITVRQKYRNGRVFVFAPFLPGQTEPFPDPFVVPANAPSHIVEGVSLPSAARALGRADEAWLIQVCVHQRVVQTHFALYSSLTVEDIFHLQNSVKATPEIDAVFLMTYRYAAELSKAIITLETKRNEPILEDQIRAQVAYMAKQCISRPELEGIGAIVPIAARSERRDGKRQVALFEMAPITVIEGAKAFDDETEHLLPLTLTKTVCYNFSPTISGI